MMASRMDSTFYGGNNGLRGGKEEVNQLKRKMTLDFNSSAKSSVKKQKFNPVLSSPDLNLLKLGSPELERIIMQHSMLPTPTPSQFVFPKSVTEEQEQYARGFVDALAQMHQSSDNSSEGSISLQPVDITTANNTFTSDTITYTTLESNVPISVLTTSASCNNLPVTTCNNFTNLLPQTSYPVTTSSSNSYINLSGIPAITIKDDPDSVSPRSHLGSTPPMSPINMESQEKIKLERKRQRNRVAASKCRRRKLERIARLEDRVKHLKGENAELLNVKNRLKEDVCHLKQEMLQHVHGGCQILITTQF